MRKRHSRMITLVAMLALTLVTCMLPAVLNSSARAEDAETTGSITNGGTNFREGPGKKYHSIMKLDRGTVVTITSVPDSIGEDYWYGVSYAGKNGYVNSEFVRVLSGDTGSKATVSPTATPTPPPSTDGYNAVELTMSSCHLRKSPNGARSAFRRHRRDRCRR